jgi:hypothetical protein
MVFVLDCPASRPTYHPWSAANAEAAEAVKRNRIAISFFIIFPLAEFNFVN